jgi:PAS domain S-box-containing protein
VSVKQSSAAELRRKANERLAESKLKPSEELPDSDVRAQLHELQVHQIELEMQNAELLSAEAATNEAMQKYANLFDFAPIGYFLWDEQEKICEVNLAGAALLGLDRSAVLNRPFGHFVVPEDHSTFADFCQRTMRTDAKQTCEVKVLNGVRRVHVLIEGIAASDRGGNDQLCRVAVIDISEQVLQQELVREQDATLHGLLDVVDDSVLVFDLEGTILACNPIAAKRFGKTPNNMIGHSIYGFLPSEIAQSRKLHVEEAAESGKRVHFEDQRAGMWFENTVYPVFDNNRMTVHFVVFSRDISERKRAEEEKRELERRLLHAQKLESLGVLAGGIAHDFNNVLAGIMGFAELARLRLPELEPALTDIEVIKHSVQRAADLTRQMLAYSGKGKFIVESVSLSQIVEDSRKMLAMSVSKKVTLAYNLAPDLPAIQGDASQMHQILLNLVINASEAIGEQNGVISVSTDTISCSAAGCATVNETAMPEGCYVRLKVADTGCGMNQETLTKIFDPFFTTKFTGRGLGLAAVLGIVRGHKGTMRVASKPGEGTSFEVLLPSSGAAPISAGTSISAMPWRGSGTVLVVDDDDVVRDLASRMLEHVGFVALTAKDGEEAIRVYEQRKQDIACVLLDLTMPKMNGAETFRELHRISPDVRVVLSSGYSEEDAIGTFSQLGLAGFIQKPYQFDKMVATVRAALEGGNADGTPADIPCAVANFQRSETDHSTDRQPLLGTVLVVDDDETNRKSTQLIFKHAGFSTLAAEDGEEAIRIYQEHQNQCVGVFLDLHLPKKSGEEVFRELRRICPSVRVIVTSGYPAEFLEKRLAGLDVFGFVCKPDSPEDAIAKLRETILRYDREHCI